MNPVFEAFELAVQYRHLAELLAERQDDPQVIEDTLESLSGPLDEQLENLAKMVRNIEAAETGIAQTMVNLEARQASLQRAAERGRRLIRELMQAAQRERINTALFSMALKKNPPQVVVDNPNALPEAYLTRHEPPPPTPNKKAIACAIKAGNPVPGAHCEQSVRLEIH
jgi:ABC-type transporter Mla subunit MlaD